jgi:hypothetical protein
MITEEELQEKLRALYGPAAYHPAAFHTDQAHALLLFLDSKGVGQTVEWSAVNDGRWRYVKRLPGVEK